MAQGPTYLKIEQDAERIVATIQLEELLYSMDVEAVHRQLEDLLHETPTSTLILNLEHVTAVSSELIGSVLMLQRQAREGQGSLRLCCLDERVMHTFRLSRVDSALDLYPTLEAAQR